MRARSTDRPTRSAYMVSSISEDQLVGGNTNATPAPSPEFTPTRLRTWKRIPIIVTALRSSVFMQQNHTENAGLLKGSQTSQRWYCLPSSQARLNWIELAH